MVMVIVNNIIALGPGLGVRGEIIREQVAIRWQEIN